MRLFFPSNLPKKEIEDIIQFTNIQSKSIHTILLNSNEEKGSTNSSNKSIFYEKAKNCEKQVYQKEILSRFYKTSFEVFMKNFYDYHIASQSFCFLLDFIYQHNPHLIRKLDEPLFENKSQRLILANHTLKQLNIIDDHQYQGPYSSVLKMLNKCQTPMGKRKFAYQLLNPTKDPCFLKREYSMIDHFLVSSTTSGSNYEISYSKLAEIKDLSKWERQVFLKKITPKNFSQLYKNLILSKSIYENILQEDKKTNETFLKYLSFYEPQIDKVGLYCEKITEFIEKHLILEEAAELDTLTSF